jgi:hypothetical protein
MKVVLFFTLIILMSGCNVQLKDCKFDPGADITVQKEKVEKSEDGTETTTKKDSDISVSDDTTIRINPKADFSCPF